MKGMEARLLRELTAVAPATVRPVRPIALGPVKRRLTATPRQSIVQSPEYMPENTLRCAAARAAAPPPTDTPSLLVSYAPFIGGAILAKTVFPQNQHVSKYDYHEAGPSVVSRRL